MKVFIVLSALVVAVSAGGYANNGAMGTWGVGGWNGVGAVISNGMDQGSSTQFRNDDDNGNYQFGYDEAHTTGGSSRREEEVGGVRRGSYSLMDADGRRRTVNYVADAAGFRATVDSNEPGVDAKSPADVIMNGAAPAVSGFADNSGAWNSGAWNAGMNTWAAAPVVRAASYAAPAVTYSAPAPVMRAATTAYVAPRMTTANWAPMAATTYAAPAAINTGYMAAQQIEAPTPRAFSYSFSSAHQAPMRAYSAPAAMTTYSAPAAMNTWAAAPAAMTTYSAPAMIKATTYAAPAAVNTWAAAPAAINTGYMAAQQIEAPTPRAFSYSFNSAHQAPISSTFGGISAYAATPLATNWNSGIKGY